MPAAESADSGCASVRKMELLQESDVPRNVPSLVDIKKILPKHCFQPKLGKSCYYVIKDLVLISLIYCAYILLENYSSLTKWICAPVYWYLQGTMFWALFVLGHDCGHGSFSHYGLINDIIGTLLHR